MNVVIDGRALVGNRTGIGVHTAEIARRLAVDPPPLIASHAEIANREGLEDCRFEVNEASLGVVWQQLTLPRIDGDVLWGPHGTLPVATKIPAVATLHDFTSLTMPGRHRLKTILSFNLFIGRSLEIASRIACVSRAVADEAMRGFAVPAWKMEIVPNGVDEFFSPGGEEEDYILYAGTLEPRKGIEELLGVWWSLPQPRPRLVVCGDPGWRVRMPDGVEVLGYVTRERLRELYRRAMTFVYPSRYEGFGIPPLEAMACGAPVIATPVGAIPEYGAGVVQFVPPGNLDALRAAMLRLIGDPALRRELRARGPERAAQWRWDASARTMTELLACA
ncbi:MAG TPA: glycosyltransferase family 1 protein [Thermoanaerobaculia bacterium]|nr:glycosyltransferase family 1 protein [Thermoanaerobaculia bacterium]